ncbi:CatB-related O-acetyltransferase [Priestia megaterium]|uniref:xenobiotic acyltransferase family protein n=1 Tax=Priestia megaterium TaxID=1404 RepID=UPI003D998FBC
MSIAKYIPVQVKQHIKLIRNRKRYKGSQINSEFIDQNVIIGKECVVNRCVQLKENVKIGDYTYLNDGSLVGQGVSIGKYCSISYNCQIGLSDHPTNYVSSHPVTYGPKNLFDVPIEFESRPPCVIGNDVWIGGSAIILRGVEIGDGAIIAAGSIVTKDVKPYSIVSGIPASEARKRFSEESINYLQSLKWWDLTVDELLKHKELFTKKEEWESFIPKKK